MDHSIISAKLKLKLKIIILGSQGVGKSSIIEQYINKNFEDNYNATVGIDFLTKSISLKSKQYRLQLWDTAGQQRFRSLIPSYLKDADCAFIIFDVGRRSSLFEIDFWVKMFYDNKGANSFIFIIGNKVDLQNREVTEEEGRKKAESLKAPYCQISAKTGKNVDELFIQLIQQYESRTNSQINDLKRQLQAQVGRKQKLSKTQHQKRGKSQQTQNHLTQKTREVQIQPVQIVALKNKKIEDTMKVSQKQCC